ncbi:SRP40, C-terminal domain-containing protein [Xylariaceae sp. FL0662B]|nr:SRP40, C-terminal domain-containing protein [Xylariaceae sp. FL0662B]
MSKHLQKQPTSTPSQGPPSWLFTNNSSKPSTSNDTRSATMAKKVKKDTKSSKAVRPTITPLATTSASQAPPAQLMDLVESFLSDQGFDNAHREFQKHRVKKGWKREESRKKKPKSHNSLVRVFRAWETFTSQNNTPIAIKDDPMDKITKVSSSSSSSSSSESDSEDTSSESERDNEPTEDVAMKDIPAANESSSESSDSSSSSESSSDSEGESESENEAEAVPTAVSTNTPNPLKRKAESDSESSSSESDSDSDSDMSDSSSDDRQPQAKKIKTQASSDESSSSSSSSDDESSDEEKPKANKAQINDDGSSSGSESDSSESDSDSEESEVNLAEAAQVPLPESGSSSSTDSESESENEKPQLNTNLKAVNSTESRDTSATLEKTSPELAPSTLPPLPPDPNTVKANNRAKNGSKTTRTQNEPFSRIRKDVMVDPKLSSNAYVSHGYGEKAHQDLIVTKGKGFTKEKNKKKRGSYKGGPLDIHQSRSIKFDD